MKLLALFLIFIGMLISVVILGVIFFDTDPIPAEMVFDRNAALIRWTPIFTLPFLGLLLLVIHQLKIKLRKPSSSKKA